MELWSFVWLPLVVIAVIALVIGKNPKGAARVIADLFKKDSTS